MAFGLPTLRHATAAANVGGLLVADALEIKRLLNPPKWGIYQGATLKIEADSVVTVSYKQDSRLSDYPQEAGSFQSYNKVATPYEARIRLSKGGSNADRATFLAAIEAFQAGLDLFDLRTPERTYTNANIQRFDYERSAGQGLGLITVELWLVEVRTTAKSKFTNAAQPTGVDTVNAGTLQADIASARSTAAMGGGR